MTTQQPHPNVDVIVCGAGPVGLFLACELALAACRVLVLEQAPDPASPLKEAPFGIRGLSAPSIDALHRRGLRDALPADGPTLPHVGRGSVGHFAGIQLHDSNLDMARFPYRPPGSPPLGMLTTMAALEAMLACRARELGVTILRGVAAAAVRQTADRVTVNTDGQAFHAAWVVGCDGARSRVRKTGGFDTAGTAPEFTGYTTHVDVADPTTLRPGRNLTAAGMYVQTQPGHIIIQDFDGGAFHDTGQPPLLPHLQAVLRRVSGTDVTLTALHVATTWTDRARQATRYRNERILLAGDAAHIHSPLGGQGLNLGLGDAMNLGWKLAATIHGAAPPGLLDTYETERHPVGAAVLDWSRAQVAVMRPDPGARALYAILDDLLQTRDGTTYAAGRIRGITTCYHVGEDDPLAGRSAPDLALDDGTRLGEWMRAGHGLLFDPDEDAALASFAASYGEAIGYVARRPAEGADARAMLVRPDGIVAWAADGAADKTVNAAALERAAARWFVRPRPCRRPGLSAAGT